MQAPGWPLPRGGRSETPPPPSGGQARVGRTAWVRGWAWAAPRFCPPAGSSAAAPTPAPRQPGPARVAAESGARWAGLAGSPAPIIQPIKPAHRATASEGRCCLSRKLHLQRSPLPPRGPAYARGARRTPSAHTRLSRAPPQAPRRRCTCRAPDSSRGAQRMLRPLAAAPGQC